jgi:Skp family chaperone for outer membrane proteins
MATLLHFKKEYQDTATGCKTTDEAALQTCIQTYYQRQQPSGNLQQENSELKTQVQDIRSELDALKSQPTTTAENVPSQTGINEYGNVIVFASILITILVTVILTKHFTKK